MHEKFANFDFIAFGSSERILNVCQHYEGVSHSGGGLA